MGLMPEWVYLLIVFVVVMIQRWLDRAQQREWRVSQEELFKASMDLHQRTMTMVIRGAAGQLDPPLVHKQSSPPGVVAEIASTSPVQNDEEAELLRRAEAEIIGMRGVGAR